MITQRLGKGMFAKTSGEHQISMVEQYPWVEQYL